MIDLRSDTVTLPTKAMLEAMSLAEVGDDVYGEDPSINHLQEKLADIFGMEAALFCPSGTMCNQIAVRVHTQPQDEVICDKMAHVYLYEGGGLMANSLVSVRLVEGDRGRLKAEQIEEAINPDNPHFPRTKLVCLENTSNKGGGSVYDLTEIQNIKKLCDEKDLKLHLDGAKVFNAIVASDYNPKDLGKEFDTISVCLSKGLGAPVGSVLLGSKEEIYQAIRVRKMMGGGMRQAGYLAAAALYALEHHIERLAEDHHRATRLSYGLTSLDWVEEMMPVETNIVVFKPQQNLITSDKLYETLSEKGIGVSTFGKGYIRLVTHLDIKDEQIDEVLKVFQEI
ncbi:MAG: GntG family PLP-dependent aldolase [Bacteroidota bacterium]